MKKKVLMTVLAVTVLSCNGVRGDTGDETSPLCLETVVVTAQKNQEQLERIPVSVTNLSDIEIEDAGVDGLEALSLQVPNLEFHNFGNQRHSHTYIRGLRSTHWGEPALGFYVDGVNYSKSYMFDFPLFDVERIEVLRGPQGTLYGRNTLGGVINVYTREPDNLVSGMVNTTFGEDDLKKLTGSLKLPLIKNRLFMGLSGIVTSNDGYTDNDTPAPGDDGRHKDERAGRIKLKWQAADGWDIGLNMDGYHHEEGNFPFRLNSRNSLVQVGLVPPDRPFHYSHDFEGEQESDFWGSSIKIDGRIPWGQLTSVTGYREYNDDETLDLDCSSLDLMRMFYGLEEKALTQEVRLASPDDDNTRLKWVLGLYFFHQDTENDQIHFFRPGMAGQPGNPFGNGTGNIRVFTDQTTKGAAAFSHMTWALTSSLDVIGGLRCEYEDAEMDILNEMTKDGGMPLTSPITEASNDFTAILPKLGLAWHFDADHTIYGNLSKGHRSGGFNTSSPSGREAYGEEYSWTYEIGTKSYFFNRRLMINLAGFYAELEDEQIALLDPVSMHPYVENAGESHRLGLEMETRYIPLKGLELTASATLMQAEYDTYEDPVKHVDYGGNKVYGVPEFTCHLGAQLRRPIKMGLTFMGRVDVNGYGRRYLDDANTFWQSPYALVNLKLGLEGEHIDTYLWAKNLLDREYVLGENSMGMVEDGEPRALGITVRYRF